MLYAGCFSDNEHMFLFCEHMFAIIEHEVFYVFSTVWKSNGREDIIVYC